MPFALVFLVLTGALIYTGESMPLSMVVALQSGDNPVLYRPRYGNHDFTFKQLSIEARHPAIVAAGSSRVLQMRGMFFNRDSRAFYNAGAPAWLLPRVARFLYTLDEAALPDILFLGIDHPWFNAEYYGEPISEEMSDFDRIFMVNRSFMQTVLDGEEIDLGKMLARVEPGNGGLALGLRAIRDGHGFRNDGSEQYGDFLVGHYLWPEQTRLDHSNYARNQEFMYVWGDEVSQSALTQFEELLQFCQEHDIYVIGFSPPYTPSLWTQMQASGNFTYMDRLVPELEAMFEQYEYPYFDFSDITQLDDATTDNDFFDGWHGSELVYLRMYIHMLEALPERLGAYSDMDWLRERAAEATDTFEVFGDQF